MTGSATPSAGPSVQTAVIGAGVMGETLLSGLVRAGRRVDRLLVGEKRPERARELEERYGVAVVSNVEAAAKVGAAIAERAKAAGVSEAYFDRGGFLFHGKVKALADAARDAGLKI